MDGGGWGWVVHASLISPVYLTSLSSLFVLLATSRVW